MVNLTLAVPVEMKKEMDEFPEMNWSEVARQAFRDKLRDLKFIKKFRSKSKLTEEDTIELGRKVSRAVAKRHQSDN